MTLSDTAANIIESALGWSVRHAVRFTPVEDAIGNIYQNALNRHLTPNLTPTQRRIIEDNFANYFAKSHTSTIINTVLRHAGDDALSHLEITRKGNSIEATPIFQKNTTNKGYRYVMTVVAERLFDSGVAEIGSAQLAEATAAVVRKCIGHADLRSIKSRASTFISDRLGDAEKYITKRDNRQLILKRAI